jgi:hypothetical protein
MILFNACTLIITTADSLLTTSNLGLLGIVVPISLARTIVYASSGKTDAGKHCGNLYI